MALAALDFALPIIGILFDELFVGWSITSDPARANVAYH